MIGEALSGVISGALRGLGAGPAGVKLTVDQDNVLQAARIVKAEAEYFRGRVQYWLGRMDVEPMGDDPVSKEVARVLTLKLATSEDSYVARCTQYADMLDALADQLAESARTYGFTEDQVTDMFTAAGHDAEVRPARPGTNVGHGLAPI